ncbi:MAG TPA: carbamoyltransferase HypF [Kineosporiaceae bacterium]|nr:carbamoyltransferase HypF [Kineosporiaceae bacterium]
MTGSRRRVRVRGIVQGVGYRPFVYGLALELGLAGWVLNDAAGVVADVQGRPEDLDAFCRRLATDAPPTAAVEDVDWADLDPQPRAGFVIAASADDGSGPVARTLPPPDLATCDDCLAEVADPTDRRYRHPFVSCTACGPRFTILTGAPYDRAATSMARFALCADCRREYGDPRDRRFHAQTVACRACGPVLDLLEAPPSASAAHAAPPEREQLPHGDAALARAREILAAGGIVAVKGIGGYHLACDATSSEAVGRLRARKQRGDKPFAVLVRDLATAREFADVDDVEAGLLTSSRRPVVLLRPRPGAGVADEVAPRGGRVGLMLPPSALHLLLLGLPTDPPGPAALVLTSGNLSGEPIVTDDEEAVRRLSGIADAWLRHDRPIEVACDDSVVEVVDGDPSPVRRSRGEAPLPIPLPVTVEPTIAAGGDLKNVFCVAEGRSAWLSAHVGDMDDIATQRAFARAVDHLQSLVDVEPRRLVVDTHPLYRSARGAEDAAVEQGMVLQRVQHHHAHVASVLAENGYASEQPVLGVAFDGSGHGDDGAVWGGEVLLAGYGGYRRFAHLSYVPLAGGDAAVRRPYRMALAHLDAAGVAWDEALPCVAVAPTRERSVLAHQLRTGLACVPTSSMGRLFDAVASLAGVCHEVGYEAQAAMELQALAERSAAEGAYPLPLVAPAAGPLQWDCGALVRAVADDVLSGAGAGAVGVRLHRGVAAAVVRAALHARSEHGVATVALSGGVFTNALLLSLTSRGLREAGFEVLRHRRVPANDGGLALGQVVVGASPDVHVVDLTEATARS